MTDNAKREAPVRYSFRVVGRLDARWADWFDGLAIVQGPDGTTTVSGILRDQAEVHGLLARIRDLGLELLSVQSEPAAR